MTEPRRDLTPRDLTPRDLTPRAITQLLRDTEPYLSCDDCFELLDEHVEQCRSDPGHRDPPMEVHLAGCSVCAEEAAALTELLQGRGGEPDESGGGDPTG